jgi:superfamily I DNA and/or RNA helicase
MDWSKLSETYDNLELLKSILDPKKSISLVKLKSNSLDFDPVQSEALIVQKLVKIYYEARIKEDATDEDDLSVMIVTPHHIQRVAIQRRIDEISLKTKIRINTVEKLQGQECDLVFACFSCFNHVRGAEFLRDFRRWNVALSRAK